ncbi:MAG TPA: cytochrome b/b6 domain-containing protein [Syntrophales bacterium]|nr:cytochrome b/b6 domain-containing protein [Syntrophales bacterium]HPQ44135.1 cytochrome b/b6 domain-containing protein [Syntrophales bacterium]
MKTNNTWILKHPWSVRSFHYLLVLSFIPLAITGVILYFKPFEGSTMNLYMRIHVVTGVILTLDAVAYFIIGFTRVITFIKRIFSFSINDIKWFSILGGYPQKFLLRKKVAVPPMGKYNSGQKLFGICALIGGIILIATGWGLWGFPHILPHAMATLFGTLHLVFGWILILFFLIHIFLGIYMFNDFKAMFLHGKILYEEAHETAPLWVKNEIVKIE